MGWPRGFLYQPVAKVDDEDSLPLNDFEDETGSAELEKASSPRTRILVATLLLIAVCFIIAGFILDYSYPWSDHPPSTSSRPHCLPRREWRTLNPTEQQTYIASFLCLATQPSLLRPNSTLYEDFPFIHAHIGYFTHNSGPFLPWHRFFLSIYESTLHTHCALPSSMTLPYWDWTLDSACLENSPLFDPESGFGGDGDWSSPVTVGGSGHCIASGPFTSLRPSYFDVSYNLHCLSRGFRNDTASPGRIDGTNLSPSSINSLLNLPTYESFVEEIESKVHDAIPFGIGGDFETFTAPYDPLFWLHHVQLDRLWSIWQKGGEGRVWEYGGRKRRHSMEMAEIGDWLEMGGLGPGVRVEEVMDTGSGLLCYTYD